MFPGYFDGSDAPRSPTFWTKPGSRVFKESAWRSLDADLTVIDTPRVQVPYFLEHKFDPSKQFPSGSLEKLPIEILHLVFEYLDIQSFQQLALGNNWCKALIGSLPAYRRH